MFILYGLLVGLLVGVLARGRLSGLSALRFRWAQLALLGFAFQMILFSDAMSARVGDLGPPLYVASTSVVLVAVVRNWRIPGMILVALGAASNLLAIVANGGYMPTTPEAMAQLGRVGSGTYSNSAVMDAAVLPWLTDIFAMPVWMPMANVYSIGDVLIAVGIAAVVVIAMRTARPSSGTAAPGGPRTTAQGAGAGATAAPVGLVPPVVEPALLPPAPRSSWAAGPVVPALSLLVVLAFFLVSALEQARS